MIYYEGIYAAATGSKAAYDAVSEVLPAHMTGLLGPLMGEEASWVDRICHFTESVYANRGQPGVTSGLMESAAGCGGVITNYGFWDSLGGRAAGMIQALRRDSGEEAEEGFPWPDPADDPEPLPEYLPPA